MAKALSFITLIRIISPVLYENMYNTSVKKIVRNENNKVL